MTRVVQSLRKCRVSMYWHQKFPKFCTTKACFIFHCVFDCCVEREISVVGFCFCRPQPIPLLVEVPPSVSGNESDLEELRPHHPDPALLNG